MYVIRSRASRVGGVLAVLLILQAAALPVGTSQEGGFVAWYGFPDGGPGLVPDHTSESTNPQELADQFNIEFEAHFREEIESFILVNEGRILYVFEGLDFMTVRASAGQGPALKEGLLAQQGVERVLNDIIAPAVALSPNDPNYGQQWGPGAIGLPNAWDSTFGAGRMYILDTGVDFSHEDLAPNTCVSSSSGLDWDFVNNDAVPADDHGHGTHVLGIAAAAIDNSKGIAGTASDACAISLKVANAGGMVTDSSLAAGINFIRTEVAAVAMELAVGSASLASSVPIPLTEIAAQRAAADGRVLLVAAAGNTNQCVPSAGGAHLPMYPASYPEFLSVGNLASTSVISATSCQNSNTFLAAPGTDVLSTKWCSGCSNQYVKMTGTSMATPFVSGVASLVADAYVSSGASPNLRQRATDVKCILMLSADDVGPVGPDRVYGFGRVDADQAVALSQLTGSISNYVHTCGISL